MCVESISCAYTYATVGVLSHVVENMAGVLSQQLRKSISTLVCFFAKACDASLTKRQLVYIYGGAAHLS
jgi:hypothetical protein